MKEQISFRSAMTTLLDDSHTFGSMAELMESTGPVMMVTSIIEELHRHGFTILGTCEEPLVVGLFRPRSRIPQRGTAYDIPDECLYIELHLDPIEMIWVKLHPEQEKKASEVLKDLRKSSAWTGPQPK